MDGLKKALIWIGIVAAVMLILLFIIGFKVVSALFVYTFYVVLIVLAIVFVVYIYKKLTNRSGDSE